MTTNWIYAKCDDAIAYNWQLALVKIVPPLPTVVATISCAYVACVACRSAHFGNFFVTFHNVVLITVFKYDISIYFLFTKCAHLTKVRQKYGDHITGFL